MRSPTVLLLKSLALLSGAAGVLMLAGCMEREKIDTAITGPDLSSIPWVPNDPCYGQTEDAIDTDGRIHESAWHTGACEVRFPAVLTGGRVTDVIARAIIGSEEDTDFLFLSAEAGAPISGPGSALRVFFEKDVGGVRHFLAVGFQGGVLYRWAGCAPEACTESHRSVPPHTASGTRRGTGGYTAFEFRWPLEEILTFAGADVVRVRWQVIPEGTSATSTLYPVIGQAALLLGLTEFIVGGPAITIVTNYPDITVTLRDPDRDPYEDGFAFRCALAEGANGTYVATFTGLPVGSRWVATAGNKKTCKHDIWPPKDPAYSPNFDLPGKQGALYDEGGAGGAKPLIWGNWGTAADNARPLQVGDARMWHIPLTEDGRTASCTVHGTGNAVWAVAPGPPGLLQSPGEPSGLANTYARPESCELFGLSNEFLILESRNADGTKSSGSLPPGEEHVILTQDPDFFYRYYLEDEKGDNPDGQDDALLAIYGISWNDSRTGPGNDFLIKLEFSRVQERGTAQLLFEISELRNLAGEVIIPSISVQARANKQQGIVTAAQVLPANYSVEVSGSIDPIGNGFVTVRFRDVMQGIETARVRMRAGVANGYDHAPDLGSDGAIQWAPWTRTVGSGGSFRVAF